MIKVGGGGYEGVTPQEDRTQKDTKWMGGVSVVVINPRNLPNTDWKKALIQKMNHLFQRIISTPLEVHHEGKTHILYINNFGKLGRDLLEIYKTNGKGETGKEAVATYLLKAFREDHLPDQLRFVAALALAPQEKEGKREVNGLIIITKESKKRGHLKLEVFHLEPGAVLGVGGYNKAEKTYQEVFSLGEKPDYRKKDVVLRTPTRVEGDSGDDVGVLKFIQKLNHGKMPEYFQKLGKIVHGKQQFSKLYPLGNLWSARTTLSKWGQIKALEGPVLALKNLKELGIGHTDLKNQNYLGYFESDGAPKGVLSDFSSVLVFPNQLLDLIHNNNSQAAKKMAQDMVAVATFEEGKLIPIVHKTPQRLTENDYMDMRLLLVDVWPYIDRLSKGVPSHNLSIFERKYKELQKSFEKIQVMQTGIAVYEIFKTNDKVIKFNARNNTISEVDFTLLEASLKQNGKIPENSLAALMFFFKGTMPTLPGQRFTAEQTIVAYEAILKDPYLQMALQGDPSKPYLK